jgi:hypothetical protein
VKVDDAGRHAGAALRDRFDRLPAPPLAETAPRRSRSGRTAVLAGIAAVLVVALVTGLVTLGRDDDPQPAGPGGIWRRIDANKAFGHNASPDVITSWRGRLLALGAETRAREPVLTRPAVWTSENGEHWNRVEIDHAPSRFSRFVSVAVRGRVIIATTLGNPADFWRSTDVSHWRRVDEAPPAGRGTTYTVARRPGGFVAMTESAFGSTIALASRDGRRWHGSAGSRGIDRRTGLLPGAPLGREFITLWGEVPGTDRPLVYRSRDRIRWNRITEASTPKRLGEPLAADHERSRVLGIQYERYGQFGAWLWSTRDGRRWDEIRSFHRQLPAANPTDLVQAGRWWVLGGKTGVPLGVHRASMWVSPDLDRWYEMPRRLRGPDTPGLGVSLVEHDGRVIGRDGDHLWIWTPPE